MPLCFGVRAGGQPAPVGAVSTGRPDLLSVNYEVVAVSHGLRLDRGEIGAGSCFGVEGAPGVLKIGDFGNELVLLLFRAVEHERGADPGDAHVEAYRCARVSHLFVVDDLLHDARFHAAVLFRPGDGQPAAVSELAVEVLGEIALYLDTEFGFTVKILIPSGCEFCLQEVLNFGSKSFFFGGETKVHI